MTHNQQQRGFTLVELLVVMAIVAILAGLSLAALAGAAEEGRRQRARTQIARIDMLINEKWNSYRYRQVPIRIPAGTDAIVANRARLNALRELQKFEMPDRMSDIYDDIGYLTARPSLSNAYRRRVLPLIGATPNNLTNENAECLYLILSEMRYGDKSALSHFMPSEIGDADGDGLNEILDPWGTPIAFLRWAPGYSRFASTDSQLGGKNIPTIPYAVDTMQIPDGAFQRTDTAAQSNADPFDPLKADPRWSDPSFEWKPFVLRPLIVSAGPSRRYDLLMTSTDMTFSYRNSSNDPYVTHDVNGVRHWFGTPVPYESDGYKHGDNITNHGLALEGQ
jgi:prepilin-type N-terminal cleavage/methylation domain-containing protein